MLIASTKRRGHLSLYLQIKRGLGLMTHSDLKLKTYVTSCNDIQSLTGFISMNSQFPVLPYSQRPEPAQTRIKATRTHNPFKFSSSQSFSRQSWMWTTVIRASYHCDAFTFLFGTALSVLILLLQTTLLFSSKMLKFLVIQSRTLIGTEAFIYNEQTYVPTGSGLTWRIPITFLATKGPKWDALDKLTPL